MQRIPRRRMIAISAAAAGMPLLPAYSVWARPGSEHVHLWRGAALGADAILQIHHPDARAARRLIALALAEVERLERIFSLYRDDSAITALNRDGALDEPPTDLVALLSQSVRFGQLTAGVFDVTIQPLWALYAEHFSRRDARPEGPDRAAIERALARIDYRAVTIAPRRIRLEPGMAITLNGIAQGYVTDRVVDLLRREGIAHSLVDIGEIRAIGARTDGAPWTVGLEDPGAPGKISERLDLADAAVATSGGYGLRFDPAGRFNHLLDPRTGGSAHAYLAVSVVAPTATVADALSTAFSFMPPENATSLARDLNVRAHFVLPDGTRIQST